MHLAWYSICDVVLEIGAGHIEAAGVFRIDERGSKSGELRPP